jgi:hypothetical protein
MEFYPIVFEAHSGWRWVVILVGVIVILKMLIGWLTQGQWSSLDRRLGLALTAVLDIQFLLGLILWIMLQGWTGADGALRSWEHPITMLLATSIAHAGWARARRATADVDKYRTATLAFLLSGILVAVGILRITGAL